MEFQVSARKWRPQKFSELIGQEHIVRTLRNAIELGKISHAYLFSGTRGVGKTTTARILAKALNCEQQKDNNPCGICISCIEITKGNNLDVQEFDGASNRGIDEIRELREAVKYPPNKGKYRIYIIDEVHMLTREAFNALLKTLEEPPSHVIFIMATTDAHKVPPTILSRTQRFDFKHISINDISNYLTKILKDENIQFDLQGLHLIAQKASGSLRDALSLIDQIIAYAKDILDIKTIRDVLGIIKENTFLDIVKNLEQKNNQGVIKQLTTIINEGYSISDFIAGFNGYLRNCMIIKTGEQEGINISDESARWVVSCRFSTSDFLRMLDLSLQFESNLKFIQQQQISLESLFIKLSMMDSSVDIAKMLQNNTENSAIKKETIAITDQLNSEIKEKPMEHQSIPKKSVTQPVVSVVSKTQSEQSEEITFEDIKNSWSDITSRLETTNSKTAHFIEEAKLNDFDGKQLIIAMTNNHRFHIKTLEKDIDNIESVIKEKLKQKIKVKFIIKDKSNNDIENKKNENSEHPLFMKALEKFDGEIIR